MQITKAGIQDLERLQQIGRQTFAETFAPFNSEADMAEYLQSGFSTEKLTAEISDPDSAFYLAEHDGQTIGYLKINTGKAQTEINEDNALEIERIYVLKAYHGQKVGQLLYEKALSLAHEKQVAYIWLGVWEKNPRAIRFYAKNGFVPFGKHIFKLGNDEQTDIMMRLELG